MLPGVDVRPTTPTDRAFLTTLYRTTREAELDLTGWTEPEKAAFVEMQFDAQDRYYRETYPDGRFLLVLRDGEPAGRLYLVRLDDELRLVDVTLMPDQRASGIGSALLAAVAAEADAAGVPIRLHVEPWNPARRLYERHGFATIEQRGILEFMERPAGAGPGRTPPPAATRVQLKTAS